MRSGRRAAIGDVVFVFVGVAVFFSLSVEARSERRRALAVIHELRARVHLIDMSTDSCGSSARGFRASRPTW